MALSGRASPVKTESHSPVRLYTHRPVPVADWFSPPVQCCGKFKRKVRETAQEGSEEAEAEEKERK